LFESLPATDTCSAMSQHALSLTQTFIYIPALIIYTCFAETGPTSTSSIVTKQNDFTDELVDESTATATLPFYEDVNTLKFIAIAALVVLICCCAAIITFVRRQVRQTEEGAEMQQYIHEKKTSMNSVTYIPSVQYAPAPTELLHDRSHSSLMTLTQSTSQHQPQFQHSSTHSLSSNARNARFQHMRPHSVQEQEYLTPGEVLEQVDEEHEVEKAVYLVRIAQQNELKLKFKNMDQQSQYEDQYEDDEDFGNNLNDALKSEQYEQDKIFDDMANEQEAVHR